MRETFRVSRLKNSTPQPTQHALLDALKAVPGVVRVTLKPETHEFVIHNEGAGRTEVIMAASQVGFFVQNNTSDAAWARHAHTRHREQR